MENKKLDIMMLIVPRNKGERIVPELESFGAQFLHVVLGHGTVQSEALNFLGLGDPEREVLLATVEASKVKEIYARLEKKFKFETNGNGVACTIPIASVGGAIALSLLEGLKNV